MSEIRPGFNFVKEKMKVVFEDVQLELQRDRMM